MLSARHSATWILIALLSGCGEKSEAPDPGGARRSAKVRFQLRDLNAPAANALTLAPNLSSLKILFTSLNFCRDYVSQGGTAGYGAGCVDVYKGPEVPPVDSNGDLSPLADAALQSDDGYVDVLDPAQRATLTRDLEFTEPGTYTNAGVGWHYPMKFTAEFEAEGAARLYTHSGTTSKVTSGLDGPGGPYVNLSTKPLTEGPAEETVVLMNTGGALFFFQRPLEITQEDIDNQVELRVDLAFNADGAVQGFEALPYRRGGSVVDSAGNLITLPLVAMTPVPYRAGETLVRERYVGTWSNPDAGQGASGFDIRLEFFTAKEDPTRAVLGVHHTDLVTAATPGPTGDTVRIRSIEKRDDGALRLLGDMGNAFIESFPLAQAVGDVVTAKVCMNGACDATVEFELVSRDEL